MSELDFRPVRDNADILEIVRLQQEIWGFDDLQISPPDLLKVHKKLGGTVFGVFKEDGTAVAFCYSFCGLLEGEPIHWSHMLGVAEEARGKGLGKALKWMQREHMLEQGIRRCQWTWDPLEPLNTHLNIVTLGAVTNTYEEDIYGITSGPLHTGLPTDRFVADWWITSDRVERALEGNPEVTGVELSLIPSVFEPVQGRYELLVPGEYDLNMSEPLLAVPVRKGMMKYKFEHPDAAMKWRQDTRAVFQAFFNRGYYLTDVALKSRFGDDYIEYILEKVE